MYADFESIIVYFHGCESDPETPCTKHINQHTLPSFCTYSKFIYRDLKGYRMYGEISYPYWSRSISCVKYFKSSQWRSEMFWNYISQSWWKWHNLFIRELGKKFNTEDIRWLQKNKENRASSNVKPTVNLHDVVDKNGKLVKRSTSWDLFAAIDFLLSNWALLSSSASYSQ